MTTDLRSRIAAVRGPGIARASASWSEVCKRRARDIYQQAVMASGGYLPAARREQCDESTVRDRCHDPRRNVYLAHALAGLDRVGMYELAQLICDFADETEVRRVS